MQIDRIKDCVPIWWCYWHHAMPTKRGWCVGVCKAPEGANVGDVVRMCTYIEAANIKKGLELCRERGCRNLCLSVKNWPRAADFSIYQAPLEMTELAAALIHASSVGTLMRMQDVKTHREFYAKINKVIETVNKGGKT